MTDRVQKIRSSGEKYTVLSHDVLIAHNGRNRTVMEYSQYDMLYKFLLHLQEKGAEQSKGLVTEN